MDFPALNVAQSPHLHALALLKQRAESPPLIRIRAFHARILRGASTGGYCSRVKAPQIIVQRLLQSLGVVTCLMKLLVIRVCNRRMALVDGAYFMRIFKDLFQHTDAACMVIRLPACANHLNIVRKTTGNSKWCKTLF